MRRLLAVVALVALIATPVAAAPLDIDRAGPSITTRVLEIVTGWLSKLGQGWGPNGAKNDDDSDRGDHFPPLDGAGMEWDPNG